MMKLSGWKHRLEAFAATRRKAVETQSSHRREGAGRHKNTPGPPVNGENISLDVPFYRTLPTALGNPQEQRIPTFTTATAAAIVPGAAVHTQPHSNNNIPRWAGINRRNGPKEVAKLKRLHQPKFH